MTSTRRGYLHGAIDVLACCWRLATSCADGRVSGTSTIKDRTTSPRTGSEWPTTAASTTAGCERSATSTSWDRSGSRTSR